MDRAAEGITGAEPVELPFLPVVVNTRTARKLTFRWVSGYNRDVIQCSTEMKSGETLSPGRPPKDAFFATFSGTVILAEAIGVKIANKHSVYESDLNDAFGDPFMIVMRSKRKSPPVKDKIESQGRVYELLCATESRRILFIVGRLFPSGGFYIITAYWAKGCLAQLYYRESEVFREHDEDEEKYCKSGENP